MRAIKLNKNNLFIKKCLTMFLFNEKMRMLKKPKEIKNMKINDYKVEINEKGEHELFAIRNTEKIFVGEVAGSDAEQVEENAKQLLEKNGMELVNVQEVILEREDLVDRKGDLSYVRTQMRKIMKELGNSSTSLEQKKSMLGIYGTMCNAATIITKACVVELAYDKMGREL